MARGACKGICLRICGHCGDTISCCRHQPRCKPEPFGALQLCPVLQPPLGGQQANVTGPAASMDDDAAFRRCADLAAMVQRTVAEALAIAGADGWARGAGREGGRSIIAQLAEVEGAPRRRQMPSGGDA